MIEYLWSLLLEAKAFIEANFDPARDIADIAIITIAIYWLLLLIRGTRAVQVLVGLLVLIALSLASEAFQLAGLGMVLDRFMEAAVLIIVVLFAPDIRRALARVGRGFFPVAGEQSETVVLEEIVQAAQSLAQRRVGALIVLERDTALSDQLEAGSTLDAQVTKELLSAIFLPPSPLHDGAVLVQDGRISSAGCILPLTLRQDLPEGFGTRHRAALGITEETDAVVIVVSEETASISVVMSGEMLSKLDGPRLRVVLQEILSGERRELPPSVEVSRPVEVPPHDAELSGGEVESVDSSHSQTAG
jgi:diadenylate cyclase